MNDFGLRFFGFSPDELLGSNVIGTIVGLCSSYGEDLAAMIDRITRYPEKYVSNENENIRWDGTPVWILWTNSAIRDSAGRVVEILSVGNDITQHKKVDEELVQARRNLESQVRERTREIDDQRNRLQTILDTLPISLFITDTRGNITFANQIARAHRGGTFPYTVEELLKAGIWWTNTGKPMDIRELISLVLGGKTIEGVTVDIKRTDGACLTLLSSDAPLYDAHGNIIGAMVASLDITEMRKLEGERDESRQEAELYLDLMSHDMTNMNQALMGNLELMQIMQETGQIDTTLIDNSIEVIKRSSRMINDVKKLTLLRTRNIPQKRVSLRETLSAVVAKYSAVPGRSVIINFAPGPNCVVMASDLLEDVFDNLVDNAIRHSIGPVTIDISIDRVTLAGRPCCQVTVADNGPGIPPDLKRKIFMTPEELREKAVRRGFGLYLVRTLVDYYHGQVRAEDRVPGDYGQGARFVVILPAVPAVDK